MTEALSEEECQPTASYLGQHLVPAFLIETRYRLIAIHNAIGWLTLY